MTRRSILWGSAALLSLVASAAVAWAASRLAGQHIGLNSEPLSVASNLAPASRARGPGGTGSSIQRRAAPVHRHRTTPRTTTTTTTTATSTASAPAPGTASSPPATVVPSTPPPATVSSAPPVRTTAAKPTSASSTGPVDDNAPQTSGSGQADSGSGAQSPHRDD